jgi:hypothetical protein
MMGSPQVIIKEHKNELGSTKLTTSGSTQLTTSGSTQLTAGGFDRLTAGGKTNYKGV